MEKCGMQYEGMRRHYDMDVKYYSVTKDQFEERAI
jgi:RimJ/RimL family protein N-acetyltransferase